MLVLVPSAFGAWLSVTNALEQLKLITWLWLRVAFDFISFALDFIRTQERQNDKAVERMIVCTCGRQDQMVAQTAESAQPKLDHDVLLVSTDYLLAFM